LVLEEKNKELIKSFIDEVFDKRNLAATGKYLAAEEKHENCSKSP
jgi:hypothetical protein